MKSLITMLLLSFIAVWVCPGCSHQENYEKPIQDLVQDGMQAFEEGQYQDAIKNFEQLRDWYPFSKYAMLAELKIADAHYYLGQYEEAVYAYQAFEQLHPRNEAVPYVIYQTGLCYFERIDTVDRDPSSAQKALETFQRLLRQYPSDSHSQSAKVHITACYKNLAGHDLYVGIFYYKKKRYKAALQRFLAVIEKYPDTGEHQRSLAYIANCEAFLQQEAEAAK